MKTLLLTATLAALGAPCFAMFCDEGIVSEGDTQIEVLKRCGEPDYVATPEVRYSGISGRRFEGRRTPVMDWIYNFGPRRFIYTVTF